MAKPHVTRTMGPIHFEDLDPHRFEDLVRQLAYDFRAWRSIESTGRGGADDGFDVRAYEEVRPPSRSTEDDSEGEEAPHPMEGNLWMIQCKREKAIGPKKLSAIIVEGVNPDSAPYGYVLAAPVNFSKTAHDTFREELRQRNVMEFYLWGAGELEDMLYQPKNDHILFAFFGISLTSRRRSRTGFIRAAVSAKNKLVRALGDNPGNASVLVRDTNDECYPYEDACSDFAKRPPWRAYSAVSFHPLGLAVSVNRYFACFDRRKRQWDYTKATNMAWANVSNRAGRERSIDESNLGVKGFWEQLPRSHRATFVRNGLIRFDQIEYIDDKGDTEYDCPHIFVAYNGARGPFWAFSEYLEINEHYHESVEGLERAKIFPETFPTPSFGNIYRERLVALPAQLRARLRHGRSEITLFCVNNEYDDLMPTDVVSIAPSDRHEDAGTFLKVTSTKTLRGSELLETYSDDPTLKHDVEQQIGREVKASDKVRAVEVMSIYDWQIDQGRPVI